jgi:hypothetical protein
MINGLDDLAALFVSSHSKGCLGEMLLNRKDELF